MYLTIRFFVCNKNYQCKNDYKLIIVQRIVIQIFFKDMNMAIHIGI